MMKKIFGFLNYGCTWLGLLRVGISVYAASWAFRIWDSDEPLPLKIFLSLIMALAVFGGLVEGLPNIADGIRRYKNNDPDILIGRR